MILLYTDIGPMYVRTKRQLSASNMYCPYPRYSGVRAVVRYSNNESHEGESIACPFAIMGALH